MILVNRMSKAPLPPPSTCASYRTACSRSVPQSIWWQQQHICLSVFPLATSSIGFPLFLPVLRHRSFFSAAGFFRLQRSWCLASQQPKAGFFFQMRKRLFFIWNPKYLLQTGFPQFSPVPSVYHDNTHFYLLFHKTVHALYFQTNKDIWTCGSMNDIGGRTACNSNGFINDEFQQAILLFLFKRPYLI